MPLRRGLVTLWLAAVSLVLVPGLAFADAATTGAATTGATTPIDTTNAISTTGGGFGAGGGSSVGAFGKVFVGLLIVVGVILLVYWGLKKTQGGKLGKRMGKSSEHLEVLSTQTLAPGRNVHLVRVGGDVLVLGATDHGVSHLHTIDHDEAVAEGLLPDPAGELAELDPAFLNALASQQAPAPLALAPKQQPKGLLEALRDKTSR